jgi:hypothetical protein
MLLARILDRADDRDAAVTEKCCGEVFACGVPNWRISRIRIRPPTVRLKRRPSRSFAAHRYQMPLSAQRALSMMIAATELGWTAPVAEANWPKTFDRDGTAWVQDHLTVTEHGEVMTGEYAAGDDQWLIVCSSDRCNQVQVLEPPPTTTL